MSEFDPELELQQLLDVLEIRPNNMELFRQSMVHASYLHEQGLPPWKGNERLEFLGDAVIGLVVTEALFRLHPEENEGVLSKIKSVVVSRATLSKYARQLGLNRPLVLGVGENKSGGCSRQSILAAIFESFVGALYLDQGYDRVKTFCLKHLGPELDEILSASLAQDDKSKLQELVQQRTGMIPRYRVIRSEGPDHNKWFATEVSLKNYVMGTGEGSSKKSAEQNAAKNALKRIQAEGFEKVVHIGVENHENSTS